MASTSITAVTPSPSQHRARGRPRGRPVGSGSARHGSLNGLTDPPPKKRKYVPGGPGGGGRYIELDGSETPVGGTGPGGCAYTGPRTRVARETVADAISSPSTSLRRREPTMPTPRYSSAAAAAAAAVQGDGYKPREERGWEEIHPQLDIEAKFVAFSAEEVDGTTPNPVVSHPSQLGAAQGHPSMSPTVNGIRTDIAATKALSPTLPTNGVVQNVPDHTQADGSAAPVDSDAIVFSAPKKRRVGRPPRRPESAAINGTVTPSTPKIVPPPGPNPREKLTLPKPTFRRIDPFASFEQKSAGQVRYVDRSMANVGYQETDFFGRPESTFIRLTEGAVEEDLDLVPGLKDDGDKNTALGGSGVGRVEYDMDEQDDEWLAAYNDHRKSLEVEPITREVFEITMTKIEKEWYALEKRIPKPNPKPPQTQRPRSGSAAAVNGEPPGASGEDQDSRCAICDDGDCENTNAIVFCDGCDLAVHQECYGVPFIPEGQWLCRKCQLIGRGTPTCIFCPNTDGAFKQTNSSRWSHLLCAIWIPEVSLGNTTFMEPVMDVEKVPKQRWKLTCYICRQKMGACIQCGNKNCFIAFHVTCARRARLFLKMKSAHGGPANVDSSVLKAYCDKHVPADWRRENDVDTAIVDAQEFYHQNMRGRLWADSQQSALAITASRSGAQGPTEEPGSVVTPRIHLTVGGNKRKASQKPRVVWKLPSGAPVIPQVVYNTVETSLQRFMIRKRKEYVAEACKYWTLKREARRGAALLKRLQLQMETFSSMEVTRRNYAGMGAAGRVRLQRRIDFAQMLLQDLARLRELCDNVKQRELEKLHDAELLKDVVDTVYCPIPVLLWPILERAQSLDGKGVFRDGFAQLRSRLEARAYTSVAAFSNDFGAVFTAVVGSDVTADGVTANAQGELASVALTAEQKDLRRLAKRIIKTVQGSLEAAIRSEAELGRRPFEKELRELEIFLDQGILSRRDSTVVSIEDVGDLDNADQRRQAVDSNTPFLLNGHEPRPVQALDAPPDVNGISSQHDVPQKPFLNDPVSCIVTSPEPSVPPEPQATAVVASPQEAKPESLVNGVNMPSTHDIHTTNKPAVQATDDAQAAQVTKPTAAVPRTQHPSGPPTPPMSSTEDLLAPLSHGGIPWYLEPFDPVGTTIQDERWTGREVVRGMSEELSELDDEELRDLVDGGDMEPAGGGGDDSKPPAGVETAQVVPEKRPKSAKSGSKKSKSGRRWR